MVLLRKPLGCAAALPKRSTSSRVPAELGAVANCLRLPLQRAEAWPSGRNTPM